MLFVRPECDRASVTAARRGGLREMFTLGLATLRNGNGWMFFFGIFIPVFWLVGTFMRPPQAGSWSSSRRSM